MIAVQIQKLKITASSLSFGKKAFEGADRHCTMNQMKSVFHPAQALMLMRIFGAVNVQKVQELSLGLSLRCFDQ